MLHHVLNALSAVGNVMDLPGSTFRDAVSGRNPFDQWLTPWHEDAGNRASGRDVLRSWNHGLQAIGGPSLISDHDTWGNFGAGLAAETLLDPTNMIFGSGLKTTLRANRNVRGFNAAQSAANAKSIWQRGQGFFPEENISKLHPALLTVDPKTGVTVPKTMMHAGPHAYDSISEDVIRNNHANLHGAGQYTSDSRTVTAGDPENDWAGYWKKGGESATVTHAPGKDDAALADAYRQFVHQDPRMAPDYKATVSSMPDEHAVRDAIEHLGTYKFDLVARKMLAPHTHQILEGGSPRNVRMAHFDIRNPFDIEAMHDVKNLKIPERLQGQTEMRFVPQPDGTFTKEPIPPMTLENLLSEKFKKHRENALSDIRDLIPDIRDIRAEIASAHSTGRSDASMRELKEMLSYLENGVHELFKGRSPVKLPDKIKGQQFSDILKHHFGTEHVQPTLMEMGHDGIVHIGGKGDKLKHQVAIAYHPNQEYKPWIARTIKPLLKEGSTAKNGIPLIANAILARQGRRHEER